MALMKSNQILRRDEYTELVYNMIHTCVWNKQDILTEIYRKEINEYPKELKKEALLKMQWDLQQCIGERDIIRVMLQEKCQKVISPLTLWITDRELYLIGYGTREIEVIPVRKIISFKMEGKKYSKNLQEQFQYTDWPELIQEKEKEWIEDGSKKKKD